MTSQRESTMRYEFVVQDEGGRWSVGHGATSRHYYESREQALRAAMNLAATRAEAGDKASVVTSEDGVRTEHASFAPEPRIRHVRSYPQPEWRPPNGDGGLELGPPRR